MKWGEIQKQTLRKMFAKQDEGLTNQTIEELKADDDCSIYMDGMVGVANEALQRIKNYAGIEPEFITDSMSEDNELKHIVDGKEVNITNDVCVLLPLYMASQLYKDDDISLATTYRNEFELGLSELYVNIQNPTQIENVI